MIVKVPVGFSPYSHCTNRFLGCGFESSRIPELNHSFGYLNKENVITCNLKNVSAYGDPVTIYINKNLISNREQE